MMSKSGCKHYLELSNLPNKISDKSGDSSYFFWHLGGNVNKETNIYLLNEKSKLVVKGAVLGSNTDKINLVINIHHKVAKTKARVHLKTYLNDSSVFNFQGTIYINNAAHESDSYLQQDNLVTSDNVICNTSPQLEISANDVRASHGATVGSFNKDEIFYFLSRGISLSKAKKVIANGFLSSVYGKESKKVLQYIKRDSLI